jgi:O-antigen/teichoic acid export membrane protein
MVFTSLLKASSKTLMTTVMITAVGFITSVITARILGPEGRGLLSGALLITNLSGNAALFGLANSFIYYKGAGFNFNYKLLMASSVLFISALAAALAFAGLQLSNEAQLHEQLLLILVMAGITGGQIYFNTITQMHEGLHFFNLMRLLLVLGNLILLLVLIFSFQTVDFKKILFTQLLVIIMLLVLGIIWAKNNALKKIEQSHQKRTSWKEVVGYGVSHHGTVLLGLVLVNFDKITLLKMGTIVEYGFYALAFTTSRLIGAVQEAVSTALYARFAGKDVVELSRSVNTAFRLTFIPMLLLAAIGAALSPWLIVWVYGKAFASVTAPFAILLFECVISGASWTLAQRFNAGGRPGLVFVRQFISVLPIFAALPFLPKENINIYLSGLMLLGGILRLIVTLAIYPYVLKETMPRILPTKADINMAFNLLSRKRDI